MAWYILGGQLTEQKNRQLFRGVAFRTGVKLRVVGSRAGLSIIPGAWLANRLTIVMSLRLCIDIVAKLVSRFPKLTLVNVVVAVSCRSGVQSTPRVVKLGVKKRAEKLRDLGP